MGLAISPVGFSSIEEQMNYFYNRTPDQIQKGDINTNTLGVYNPLYGGAVEYNFNLEANLWSALPKVPWDRAGFRIIKSKATGFGIQNNNLTALGGTSESGPIGSGRVPEYQEISIKPKLAQYQIEVSDIMGKLAEHSRDDNYGTLAQQVIYAGAQFRENLNLMLNMSAEDIIATAKIDADEANDIDGSDKQTAKEAELNSRLNYESINRIISSKAESDYIISTFDGSDVPVSPSNPWAYNGGEAAIHRDMTDAYDSVVVSPSGTLGSSDILTDSLIRRTMADLRVSGGQETSLFYGGQDTYNELQTIWTPQVRINNTSDSRSEYTMGVNGVKTFTGIGVGLHISSMYGVPFIPSKDATNTSPGNNVGDLFLLNTEPSAIQNKPLLGISSLWPIVYYEAGPGQPGYPFTVGKFAGKGAFVARGETISTNFKKQGKIRDILAGN